MMSAEALDHGQAHPPKPTLQEASRPPEAPRADVIPLSRNPESHETADQSDTAVIAARLEYWLDNARIEQSDSAPTYSIPQLSQSIVSSMARLTAPEQDPALRRLKGIIDSVGLDANYDLRASEKDSAYKALVDFLKDTQSRDEQDQFKEQRTAARILLDLAAAIYNERGDPHVRAAATTTGTEMQPMLDALKGTHTQEETLTVIREIGLMFHDFTRSTSQSRRPPTPPEPQPVKNTAASRRPSRPRRPPTGGSTRRG